MRLTPIAMIAVAVSLSACHADPVVGMATYAYLPVSIDLKCVETALRSTRDVGDVSEMRVSNTADEKTYAWDYGGELNATLELTRGASGYEYNNSNIRMGRDVNKGKAFEPLMRRVNESVEKRCGAPISETASFKSF